jgi:hypothetical protein
MITRKKLGAILFTGLVLNSTNIIVAQSVAVNTTGATADASAIMDISSTTKGMLIPRMTTAERAAITTPATGLRVYDVTTNSYWHYNGTNWREELTTFSGWGLSGNSTAATSFAGTTNNVPFRLFSNNAERARITEAGQFVVNSTAPFAVDVFSAYAPLNGYAVNGYTSGTGTAIYGSSTLTGEGVRGENNSTGTGVYGWNTSTGIGTAGIATSTGVGIFGNNNGSGNAIQGNNTGTGVGVFGRTAAAASFGVYAFNANANGTGLIAGGNNVTSPSYILAGSGGAFTGNTLGIASFTTAAGGSNGGIFVGNGIATYTSFAAGSGATGNGTALGLIGYCNNTTGLRGGGYFQSNSSFAYVGAVTAAGVLRKIEGTGTVNTVVKDLNNKDVVLSAPEAPENLFQDYGEGQLINGKAHITIDPIFSKNIVVNEQHPLRVFIQLKGDCKGTYVTNETATGFDVIEIQGGTSNVKFTYSITANRADEVLSDGTISRYSNERFAPAMGKQKSVTETIKKTEVQKPVVIDIKTALPKTVTNN